MQEEFKAFKKSNNVVYYVSNLGRVKSIKKNSGLEKILKLTPKKSDKYDRQGYLVFGTNTDSRAEQHPVHKIVCRLFIGEPSVSGLEVNHKDGDKHNNRWDNLEWVTRKENVFHAHRNNLIRKADVSGAKNPNFRVDDCVYLAAYTLNKKYTRGYLAESFNVHVSTLDSGIIVLKGLMCEK